MTITISEVNSKLDVGFNRVDFNKSLQDYVRGYSTEDVKVGVDTENVYENSRLVEVRTNALREGEIDFYIHYKDRQQYRILTYKFSEQKVNNKYELKNAIDNRVLAIHELISKAVSDMIEGFDKAIIYNPFEME